MSLKILIPIFTALSFSYISFSQTALNFDGVDDYVNLNVLQQSMALNNDAFTIEFWMSSLDPDGGIMFEINAPAGGPGDNRLIMAITGTHLWLSGDDNIGTALLYHSLTNGVEIGDSSCHHVAYSYGASTGRVYIDGVLVNTHSANFSGITTNDRFSLGQDYDNLNTSEFYNGVMDEVRFWGVARSLAEIQGNMNVPLLGTEPDLLAYYNCNQGIPSGLNTSITSLNDVTAANLDGTLNGFSLNSGVSNFVLNTCESTSSLAEAIMNSISIYPNPTNGICTIDGEPLNHAVVGVYSLLGEAIQQEREHTFPFELDFSEHKPGVYIIRIVSDQGEKVVKVVVE
jgi:hypothetical protein